MSFVHLHTHSEFSLRDATCRLDALLARAAELEMPALALTDHGTLSGLIQFYQKAKRYGVKPVLGCELYLAAGSRHERRGPAGQKAYHLLVLARDEEGYRNLIKLSSYAYLEGFYYRPRVDKELLRAHGRGLIATSSCRSGEIPRLLLQGDPAGARRVLQEYVEIFGEGNFYVEIQNHGVPIEEGLNAQLIELAREFGLPLLATNDVHYLRPGDHEAHQVLLNVQSKSDGKRRYDSDQYYFKSPEEMRALFPQAPEAVTNTLEVAERCRVRLEFGRYHLPAYPLPAGVRSADEHLAELTWQGARRRYGEPLGTQVKERITHELQVIEQMGYATYFLIVQDFVNYAKSRGIPVGPGRGSAAGSAVTYCLGITDVDPLRFDLLFERFLNPARVSMPDIDIDFCERRREEVLRYVERKYGADHVAQIVTSSTMKARGALRDVARVLGLPFAEADRIAKLIPFGASLDQALAHSPELKQAYERDPQVKTLIETAKQLEGLVRNHSTHAAGVVIAPGPLVAYCPLQRVGSGETSAVVTQYNMKDVEAIGLLKMDFLGLRTLTVLADARRTIREQTGRELDLLQLPLDDRPTYALLQQGRTKGVFQFEGSGITELGVRLAPSTFNDLIAWGALYRPGPLESGIADEYIERKHGRQPVRYEHPDLKPVLESTYGLPIYQEQLMQMAQVLAGFSLSEADELRYAIGKKVKAVMAQMRDKFVSGCVARGLSPEKAEKIFADIEKFSRYGFNKSHATAYALIAYWTAYLKANYPVHYMAALLSSVADNTDKVAEYIKECRELNLEVCPPDINESRVDFYPVGERKITFGLSAVRNVGRAAVEAILAAREEGPFTDFWDFCRRISPTKVHREVIESLIKVGAFDAFGTRKGLLACVEAGLELSHRAQAERRSGQQALFEDELAPPGPRAGTALQVPPAPADEAEEFPQEVLLRFEKELLGLYVSADPLEEAEALLTALRSCTLAEVSAQANGATLQLGGRLEQLRVIRTQKGERMAFARLEDLHGEIELTLFPKAFARCREHLAEDRLVAVTGKAERRNGSIQIVAETLEPLSAFVMDACGHLKLEAERVEPALLERLKATLEAHPGKTPVRLHLCCGTRRRVLDLPGTVRWSPALVAALEALLGPGHVRLCKDGPP